MAGIFTEENGVYSLDCTLALWAANDIGKMYDSAKIHLKDVDWIIETEQNLILVEYKNAKIAGAKHPEAFQPEEERKIRNIVQKYYDSLHYLFLIHKTKPKYYVYILEYPNGNSNTRRRLRNRIKQELPFALSGALGVTEKLIEGVDVLSIDEWNAHPVYGHYPLRLSEENHRGPSA